MQDPNEASQRSTIISAVQTPLGMLVLSALISEAILASTILALPNEQRITVVYLVVAMVFIFAIITIIVAWNKPDALYGRSSVNYKRFAEDISMQTVQSIDPYLSDQIREEVWEVFQAGIEQGRDSEPDEILVLRKIISLEARRVYRSSSSSTSLDAAPPSPIDDE